MKRSVWWIPHSGPPPTFLFVAVARELFIDWRKQYTGGARSYCSHRLRCNWAPDYGYNWIKPCDGTSEWYECRSTCLTCLLTTRPPGNAVWRDAPAAICKSIRAEEMGINWSVILLIKKVAIVSIANNDDHVPSPLYQANTVLTDDGSDIYWEK